MYLLMILKGFTVKQLSVLYNIFMQQQQQQA